MTIIKLADRRIEPLYITTFRIIGCTEQKKDLTFQYPSKTIMKGEYKLFQGFQ